MRPSCGPREWGGYILDFEEEEEEGVDPLFERFRDLGHVPASKRIEATEASIAAAREFLADIEAEEGQIDDPKVNAERRKERDQVLRLVMRAAYRIPYSDVHTRLRAFVETLSQKYPMHEMSSTPSRFVHPTAFNHLPFENPAAIHALQREYESSQLLRNVFVTLNLQPRFLAVFSQTYDHVMRGKGPLPIVHRHYLAILAAARYRCELLVRWQASEFLRHGGDERWLENCERMPEKLKMLQKLNRVLAHRPYTVTPELIGEVFDASRDEVAGIPNGGTQWSVSELVHAIVVLTTFHQLSAIVKGLGVVFENEQIPFFGEPPSEEEEEEGEEPGEIVKSEPPPVREPSPPPPPVIDPTLLPTSLDRALLRQLGQRVGSPSSLRGAPREPAPAPAPAPAQEVKEAEEEGEKDRQSMHTFFEALEELVFSNGTCHVAYWDDDASKALCQRFVHDKMEYRDFDVHKDLIAYLSMYNFDEDCFSLLSSYYEETGQLLQEEFDLIQALTDHTLFGLSVDTKKLRRAVWVYVFRVFGVMVDDYDYSHINRDLLNRKFKTYMKYVACLPQKVTKEIYNDMGMTLTDAEKAHTNFLVTSARKQVAMIYVFRSLSFFLRGEKLDVREGTTRRGI